MRLFLITLLTLGILAGTGVRVLGCMETCKPIESSDCCSSENKPAQDSHSEDHCPDSHHHHHGICCHAPATNAEQENEHALVSRPTATVKFRHQGEVAPEDPFLSSEKPPLI